MVTFIVFGLARSTIFIPIDLWGSRLHFGGVVAGQNFARDCAGWLLWELPFQALVTVMDCFLIKDPIIAYTPSLTYLRECYQMAAKPTATAQ